MNALKDKWAKGEPTFGLWATLDSVLATETMARSGFDYVCVDNQHGVNDYVGTVGHLQAIDTGDATPIVRVPWNEPGVIGKMLDAGAEGIIVPMVNSVDEAQAAVRACRYAPAGARSFGPVRASLRDPDYYASANADIACIPMIETVHAVAAIDDILEVPGVDAVYVGPADLSVTLGLAPGNNDDAPAFTEALETIVAACRRHDVVAGIHASPGLAQRRVEMGFSMVTVSADSVALRTGLDAAIAAARGDAPSSGADGAIY